MIPRFSTAPLLALLAVGCLGPWNPDWDKPTESDTDTDTDADADTDADTDADSDADTDADTDTEPSEIHVSQSITTETNWTSDKTYILDQIVFVENVLTIQAGTVVKGANGSALVVTKNGRLQATGTADAPIVFTSAQPVGSRSPGDWGGVALLGDAPLNVGTKQLEGIEETEIRGNYGGANTAANCGSLRFVRIEYAGFSIGTGNELNGLTLAGCGNLTQIEKVQVHNTLDDGIEIFGGNVNLKEILITRPGDDGLDWDDGWTGMGQFIIVQMDAVDHGSGAGDRAIEADSKFATPYQSHPTLYNVTLVGATESQPSQRGMMLRENTEGTLRNMIVMGFQKEALDLRDENSSEPPGITHIPSQRTSSNALDGTLSIENALFWMNNADGAVEPVDPPMPIPDTNTPDTSDTAGLTLVSGDDDHAFDEAAWLLEPIHENVFSQDPQLGDPQNLTAPNFTPATGSPATAGTTPPDNGFFNIAGTYMGAIAPGSTLLFFEPWAEFSDN
ncbi:MAG: hypothetical protein H6736_15940 [Alphaproteobacteria bacterium]|nr:hypothetical protein [Alphaproteobacteria bacterium]MCB9693303.1 hypothetical protein [Alphaproteobacteria bacterium]